MSGAGGVSPRLNKPSLGRDGRVFACLFTVSENESISGCGGELWFPDRARVLPNAFVTI